MHHTDQSSTKAAGQPVDQQKQGQEDHIFLSMAADEMKRQQLGGQALLSHASSADGFSMQTMKDIMMKGESGEVDNEEEGLIFSDSEPATSN